MMGELGNSLINTRAVLICSFPHSNFSPIIVPIQSSLTVTLPLDGGGRYDDLNPFPGNQPTIVKFEDKVEVMASLVRPKKITILASDGQKYVMMCKPDVSLHLQSLLYGL